MREGVAARALGTPRTMVTRFGEEEDVEYESGAHARGVYPEDVAPVGDLRG